MGWWLPRAEIWILQLGYIFRYRISIQKISFAGENFVKVLLYSCPVNHKQWKERLITILFFFFYPKKIFWLYLRLSTIIGISTDFERESIPNPECCHEWRWVFRYVLPKSNEHSNSPTLIGTWTLGANKGTAVLLPSLVGYWKGKETPCVFYLNFSDYTVNWKKDEHTLGGSVLSDQLLKHRYSLSRNHHMSQGFKACTFTSGQFLCRNWLMKKFSVYGFLGSIYRVTKTFSKAASHAGKLLWSHTLKFCFSWGHLNIVRRETAVDSKAQSKCLSAFLISGLLCVSLVLWYKLRWHISVKSGTKMMLQFVLLFITPLLTAAESWHGGPWNSCIRKAATPQSSITNFKFPLENIWKEINLTPILKQS